ncbi:MAG: hypothetical protein NT094_02900, partial [Candidatus Staskawiczbacteria bacterium]|nr:hypothetical protein [Candidatus Staskawiczbacteria bacterium]
MQSRNINITPYLDSLKDLEEGQINELLRKQTASYREFIKTMVVGDLVMTKNFYMVIPYNLMEVFGVMGAQKQLGNLDASAKHTQLNEDDFQRCKTQLW